MLTDCLPPRQLLRSFRRWPCRSARPAETSAGRSSAAQKGGKLRIILAWDDRNDLDLHVACPSGQVIEWRQRSACGGTLDVDANGDSRVSDASPIENVYFEAPMPGRYRVIVDPYAMRVSRTSPFRITIQQDGRPDVVVPGIANLGSSMKEVTVVTVEAPQ